MSVVWWALGVLVSAGVVFLAGMRGKWRFVTGAVRRMNKRFLNPRQLETAGRPGASSGVVRHVGRRSGRAHETPVGIERTPDGFAIALPYGTEVDWLKNVLVAGVAELVDEGAVYPVDHPRIVGPEQALQFFDDRDRRIFAAMRVEEFLLVDRVG